MNKPFLRNCWYVAAWSDELSAGKCLPRRLLDEPVVLWREATGQAHAVLDRCPHRFAPLSMGQVMENGSLQCRYHGLQFNGDGACSTNPHGDGAIPKAARVQSFPIVERHTAVWIWMGDPAKADASRIPDYSLLARQPHEGFRTFHGNFTVEANYELENDNLMDLSHPEFLHAGSIGSDGHHSAIYEAIQESDTRVHSNRWYAEGPCPPAFETHFPTGGLPVEHWTNMCWDAPSLLMLHVGVTHVGRPREEGLNNWSAHLITPESAGSSHYFYSHTRTGALDSVAVDDAIRAVMLHAFLVEDKPMLERIQRTMGGADLMSLKPVMLPGDAGAIRVRRLLDKLIADESEAVR